MNVTILTQKGNWFFVTIFCLSIIRQWFINEWLWSYSTLKFVFISPLFVLQPSELIMYKTKLWIQHKQGRLNTGAQCLASKREQFPVGQHTFPVPTHASDTQPVVYFLYNRKWTSFCREDWGWVVNLADLVPNTTFIYPEAGFAAILTSDWQKILTLKTPPACLHSKHMPFYFQPDLLNFFNMGGVEKCALEMGHLSLVDDGMCVTHQQQVAQ